MRPVIACGPSPVFRPSDDVFLEFRSQVDEELAETGHTNDQIAVLLGILLGGTQRRRAFPKRQSELADGLPLKDWRVNRPASSAMA